MYPVRSFLSAAVAGASIAAAAHADILVSDDVDRSTYPVFTPENTNVNARPFDAAKRGGDPNDNRFFDSFNTSALIASMRTSSASGLLDDYHGVLHGETEIPLESFTFVGGAVSPNNGGQGGQTVYVDFYDRDMNPRGGFAWDLGQYGDFVYTIDLTPDTVLWLDNQGYVRMAAATGTTLDWWYTTSALIGENQGGLPADGTWQGTIYTFTLVEDPLIPAPGSAALILAGGYFAAMRRRR